MHTLWLLAIAAGTVLATASAAGASGTASLPGAAVGSNPALAGGALLVAAALWRLARAADTAPMPATSASSAPEIEVVLPAGSADPVRELASWDDFVARLDALRRAGRPSAPVLVVRLDGVGHGPSPYGAPDPDHLVVAAAHRLRAGLRRVDTVAKFVPGELLVLLGSDASDADIAIVVRRLETLLTMPISSLENRHAGRLAPSIRTGRARLVDGRVQIDVDDARLVDAPVATVNGSAVP